MSELIKLRKNNLSEKPLSYKVYRIDYNRVTQKTSIDGLPSVEFPFSDFINKLREFYKSEGRFSEDQAEKANSPELINYAKEKIESNRLYCTFDNNNKIISFCVIEPSVKLDYVYWIFLVWTDNRYRGKGYASNLINYAENLAIQDNKTDLHIAVYKDNLNALNLYKSLGFVETKGGDMSENKSNTTWIPSQIESLRKTQKEFGDVLQRDVNNKFMHDSRLKIRSKMINNRERKSESFSETLSALNKYIYGTKDMSEQFNLKKSRSQRDSRNLGLGATLGAILGGTVGADAGILASDSLNGTLTDNMVGGATIGIPLGALAGLAIMGIHNFRDRKREQKLIRDFRRQAAQGKTPDEMITPYNTTAVSANMYGTAAQDRIKQFKQYAYQTRDKV